MYRTKLQQQSLEFLSTSTTKSTEKNRKLEIETIEPKKKNFIDSNHNLSML